MRIPQIAARVREIAEEIRDDYEDFADELMELADGMRRRRGGPRAAVTSRTMTPALEAEIRVYKHEHPEASQQDIAEEFRVNHGRVSETLSGFRR